MHRGIRFTIAAACLLPAACTQDRAPRAAGAVPPRVLERAGQPMDPLETAGHITAARLSALTGDQDGTRRHVEAMTDDMRRAMKIADPARPIDREAARAAVRDLAGVRSAAWIDRGNLLVLVHNVALRTQQTIDKVCYRLQPLGDTLAVVVHLQSAESRHIGDLDALSRNCQLASGDHAFMQRRRQVDALDPVIREQHQRNNERVRNRPRQEISAADRAALEAIPEM